MEPQLQMAGFGEERILKFSPADLKQIADLTPIDKEKAKAAQKEFLRPERKSAIDPDALHEQRKRRVRDK